MFQEDLCGEQHPLSPRLNFGIERHQSLVVIEDSSSLEAFYRARKWLEHCVEHDEACTPPNADFVPRRLVDVGKWDEPCEPFLVELQDPAPYACLSYCWGPNTENVLKTTTNNLKAHSEHIRFSSMPPGIQDAVTVCRGLHIRYLWVDSLCLIQNDLEMWLQDASSMDLIYLNSHLTIAAQEPDTCNKNFLGKQSFGGPLRQHYISVNLATTEGQVCVEGCLRTETEDEFWDIHREPYSLETRGWCFQETLLPNRRLCYNGKEMVWECLCRTICECGHIIRHEQSRSYGREGAMLKKFRLKAEPILSKLQIVPEEPRWRLLQYTEIPKSDQSILLRRGVQSSWHSGLPNLEHDHWRALISDYSKRALSRREDKLRAVSGLAKVVRDNMRNEKGDLDEYFAGLWSQEFVYDLAWQATPSPQSHDFKGPRKFGMEPSTGIPTWSWAAVDIPISYQFNQPIKQWKHQPEVRDFCSVVSIKCLREIPDDLTSATIDGCAVLSGALIPAELASVVFYEQSNMASSVKTCLKIPFTGRPRSGEKGITFIRAKNLACAKAHLDYPRAVDMRIGPKQKYCWKYGGCRNGCCTWNKHKKKEVYCFRLFSWYAYSGSVQLSESGKVEEKYMGPETWFLILVKSTKVAGAFERVGVGVWDNWGSFRGPCPLFEGVEEVEVTIV